MLFDSESDNLDNFDVLPHPQALLTLLLSLSVLEFECSLPPLRLRHVILDFHSRLLHVRSQHMDSSSLKPFWGFSHFLLCFLLLSGHPHFHTDLNLGFNGAAISILCFWSTCLPFSLGPVTQGPHPITHCPQLTFHGLKMTLSCTHGFPHLNHFVPCAIQEAAS